MSTDTQTRRRIDHSEAPGLAEAAYARFADLAAQVGPDQWDLPTDCEGWTVRDLVGHMVGAMRSAASMRELMSQQREIKRRQKRDGGNDIDIMTALQIEITADLTPEKLVAECRRLVTPAARGRAKTPGLMRRFVSIPVNFGATTETWRLGYLVDVVLTRDAWLHRIDLARALGVEPELTPDLDGRVITDVALEWGERHGRAVRLELTGPVGDTFVFGDGEPQESIQIDAVEFCRSVSGRDQQPGLLSVDVPF